MVCSESSNVIFVKFQGWGNATWRLSRHRLLPRKPNSTLLPRPIMCVFLFMDTLWMLLHSEIKFIALHSFLLTKRYRMMEHINFELQLRSLNGLIAVRKYSVCEVRAPWLRLSNSLNFVSAKVQWIKSPAVMPTGIERNPGRGHTLLIEEGKLELLEW